MTPHAETGLTVPSTGRARRQRSRTAVFALVCVLAAVAASQLHRTAHIALARHVPCEHGQWIHPADHGHADSEGKTARGHDRAAVPAARGSAATRLDHAHCDAMAVEQGMTPTVPDALFERLVTWEIPQQQVRSLEVLGGSPLWMLAPKQSPPIV